jgi:hypothetical protein
MARIYIPSGANDQAIALIREYFSLGYVSNGDVSTQTGGAWTRFEQEPTMSGLSASL